MSPIFLRMWYSYRNLRAWLRVEMAYILLMLLVKRELSIRSSAQSKIKLMAYSSSSSLIKLNIFLNSNKVF